MKIQLVIPCRTISKDLTLYCQYLGFNIIKVFRSALGRVRFLIEKEGCQICCEEYIEEAYALSSPYLEIVVENHDDYELLVDEIRWNNKMIVLNYDYPNEEHPITIFEDLHDRSMHLQVISESAIDEVSTIVKPDKDEGEEI